jgi:hypothetical protein
MVRKLMKNKKKLLGMVFLGLMGITAASAFAAESGCSPVLQTPFGCVPPRDHIKGVLDDFFGIHK